MEQIVVAEGLFFRYHAGDEWVLRGIDFAIEKGEWVAIIGSNGSGKSTLARILGGLLRPERGEVLLLGLDPRKEEDLPLIHQKVGMIFQNPENQIVGATVEDDIAFGLENIGLPPAEIEMRIDWALQRMGLTPFRMREPHRLSGGQKQRLAIAGVLAMRPEIILFDEASSMLDPQGAEELLTMMKELHEEGLTIIQITHDLEEVRSANRILLMNDGQILATGKPLELLAQESRLIASSLRPPFALRLYERFRRGGIHFPLLALDERKLANTLWRYVFKR